MVNIKIKFVTEQLVHCQGRLVGDDIEFFLTFVYAQNDSAKRKELWDNLTSISINSALCVLGDFNTVLNLDERIGGNPANWEESRMFKNCLGECGLEDLPYEGSKYTWTNNQDLDHRIYSKLDRVLGNVEWLIKFDYKIFFMERGISDHSPMILKNLINEAPRHCFKYCDMWSLDPSFSKVVADIWNQQQEGYSMYQVVRKLKMLKGPLRRLNRSKFQHLDNQVDELRTKLHTVQEELKIKRDPVTLDIEKKVAYELNLKLKANLLLKHQQAKADWIVYGDHDSKLLFYAWLKKRKMLNQFSSLTNAKGDIVEGRAEVAKVLMDFYTKQLGVAKKTQDINEEIINMGLS
ncbi:unnamed protein product [Cuscuta campestris]|uniref:Endonuclease/exonuclease/phosphatase domain-containing protein n=1 Tax=Cuscuta campestris TaxID=132261 RepID=A0A484K583_9ASTE|nr:unnamed protein product [Cuscuta campestris]